MKAIEILTDESILKIERLIRYLEIFNEEIIYSDVKKAIAEVRELLNELKESNK